MIVRVLRQQRIHKMIRFEKTSLSSLLEEGEFISKIPENHRIYTLESQNTIQRQIKDAGQRVIHNQNSTNNRFSIADLQKSAEKFKGFHEIEFEKKRKVKMDDQDRLVDTVLSQIDNIDGSVRRRGQISQKWAQRLEKVRQKQAQKGIKFVENKDYQLQNYTDMQRHPIFRLHEQQKQEYNQTQEHNKQMIADYQKIEEDVNDFELPHNQFDELDLAAYRLKRNFELYQQYLKSPLSMGTNSLEHPDDDSIADTDGSHEDSQEAGMFDDVNMDNRRGIAIEHFVPEFDPDEKEWKKSDESDSIEDNERHPDIDEGDHSLSENDYEVEPFVDNQRQLNLDYFVENEDQLLKEVQNEYQSSQMQSTHYPGSLLGPLPKDDPINYINWFLENCSENQLSQIKTSMQVIEDQNDNYQIEENYEDQEEKYQSDHRNGDMSVVSSRLNIDRESYCDRVSLTALENGNQQDYIYTNYIADDDDPLYRLMSGQISPDNDEFYSQFNVQWSAQLSIDFLKNMYMLGQQIDQVISQADNKFDCNHKMFQLKSVYTYYNLLPDFIRNNKLMINAANCLEYHKQNVSYEDKMKALNYVSRFCLPMDDYTAHCMQMFVHTEEQDMTDVQRHVLETMIIQEDPDLLRMKASDLFERANKFDAETSLDQMTEYHNPPRMKMDEAEEEINQVDFLYIDNEDGFWDDYLEWKEEAYAANDWIYSRPYFKH